MKKIGKFIKNNIIGFIIGVIISGATVYAATVASSSVSYSNTNSGSSATTVKAALDELYTRANTWINPNNNFGTPQYYAFGIYKGWCSFIDTNCNSYSDFPTTSTTPPSGKNVYAAKYADGGYGVCIKRNGTEHCFRGRNWIAEAQHIQKVFSDIRCDVLSSKVVCSTSFSCNVNSNGNVNCNDNSDNSNCNVNSDGSVNCN